MDEFIDNFVEFRSWLYNDENKTATDIKRKFEELNLIEIF